MTSTLFLVFLFDGVGVSPLYNQVCNKVPPLSSILRMPDKSTGAMAMAPQVTSDDDTPRRGFGLVALVRCLIGITGVDMCGGDVVIRVQEYCFCVPVRYCLLYLQSTAVLLGHELAASRS